MVDLREYKDLIYKLVWAENAKDKNWKWSVRSIGKNKARIHWSYLAGEKNDCFSVTVNEYPDDPFLENTVTYRHPTGEMISFESFGGRPGDTASTVEDAISNAIHGIAAYAHSRY